MVGLAEGGRYMETTREMETRGGRGADHGNGHTSMEEANLYHIHTYTTHTS